MNKKKEIPVRHISKLADDIRLIQDFAENFNFDNSLIMPSMKRGEKDIKTSSSSGELEYPDKITLSWLRKYVPVQFWLWLIGALLSIFIAGIYSGQLNIVRELLKLKAN